MVVGHGGEVVTAIREHAVRELESIFQKKVYLKLNVAVSKDPQAFS
jgi:GTPase Era involved in 16S rRNA processing